MSEREMVSINGREAYTAVGFVDNATVIARSRERDVVCRRHEKRRRARMEEERRAATAGAVSPAAKRILVSDEAAVGPSSSAGREATRCQADGPKRVEAPSAHERRCVATKAGDKAEEHQGVAAGETALSSGVRATSIEHYRALRASGRMTAQQLLVVEHFAAQPGLRATRQELARDLGLGINVICGRANELLNGDEPALLERGRKRCAVTGNDVNALELRGML